MHKAPEGLANLLKHAPLTRRQLIQGLGAAWVPALLLRDARAADTAPQANLLGQTPASVRSALGTGRNEQVAYGATTLPAGIRSRFVPDVNGLRMHVLEAGF